MKIIFTILNIQIAQLFCQLYYVAYDRQQSVLSRFNFKPRNDRETVLRRQHCSHGRAPCNIIYREIKIQLELCRRKIAGRICTITSRRCVGSGKKKEGFLFWKITPFATIQTRVSDGSSNRTSRATVQAPRVMHTRLRFIRAVAVKGSGFKAAYSPYSKRTGEWNVGGETKRFEPRPTVYDDPYEWINIFQRESRRRDYISAKQ